MTNAGSSTDRRAQHVALAGFFLQLAAFLTLLGVANWSGSGAFMAATRLAAAGLPIWFVLWLMFKQITRVATEALESEELRKARAAGADTSLFEVDDEDLLLEHNRLRGMIRWMLPTVTVILAIYLIGGQFFGWGWRLGEAFGDQGVAIAKQSPTVLMGFAVFACFICYLFARYTVALARLPQWRLLHAGAVFLAATALVCLVLAAAMTLSWMAFGWAQPLAAYVIRIAMFVLGIELAVNLILDQYRPRVPGTVPRPAFDSRLAGLVTEPGGLARSIAEAINYQFGFEVSTTWFYRLLQRWFLPLVVIMLAIVFAMSSIVVVDAGEQVIIERFGKPIAEPTLLRGPGVHFKYPYPVDIVYRAPVEQLQEIAIGETEATGEDAEQEAHNEKAIVWAEQHKWIPELMLLVASPELVDLTAEGSSTVATAAPSPSLSDIEADEARASKGVAVGLLMFGVTIQYRIDDLEAYLYNNDDPVKLLEVIAYQALSDYAAQRDIDELMGPARSEFNEGLRALIQERLDEHDVGLQIVFAGTSSLHPPAKDEVATKFLAAISAETRMGAYIHAARGAARKILTAAAGTEERALELDAAFKVWQELGSDPNADPEAKARAKEAVETLMLGDPERGVAPMSGKAAALIADARAEASQRISIAAAKSKMFSAEVAAYLASPTLYRVRKQLEVYRDLDFVRKYLLVGNLDNVIIVYDTGEEAGLDQILQQGVEDRQGK